MRGGAEKTRNSPPGPGLAWSLLAGVNMMNVATLPHHPPGVLSLIMLKSEV